MRTNALMHRVILVLLAGLVACDQGNTPTDPLLTEVPIQLSRTTSPTDNPDFHLLPPVGVDYFGAEVFDAGLQPTVEVWFEGALVGSFEAQEEEFAEAYKGLWSTGGLSPATYTLRILVDSELVGEIELSLVDRGPGLNAGSTIPVRFRIHAGWESLWPGMLFLQRSEGGVFTLTGEREFYLLDASGTEQVLFSQVLSDFATLDPAKERIYYHLTFNGQMLRRRAPFTATEESVFSGVNYYMRFSPDGSMLTWTREAYLCGGGCREIWVADAEMTNPVRLTFDNFGDDTPSLSPDNRWVVFNSQRGAHPYGGIFRLAVDGSSPIQQLSSGQDWAPVYSPDGSEILFMSSRSGLWAMWIMDADGSNPRMLPGTDGIGFFGYWSPDGEWVAFNRLVHPNSYSVYLVKADGSEPAFRLTPEGQEETVFGWVGN